MASFLTCTPLQYLMMVCLSINIVHFTHADNYFECIRQITLAYGYCESSTDCFRYAIEYYKKGEYIPIPAMINFFSNQQQNSYDQDINNYNKRQNVDYPGQNIYGQSQNVAYPGPNIYGQSQNVANQGQNIYSQTIHGQNQYVPYKDQNIDDQGQNIYGQSQNVANQDKNIFEIFDQGQTMYNQGQTIYDQGHYIYDQSPNVTSNSLNAPTSKLHKTVQNFGALLSSGRPDDPILVDSDDEQISIDQADPLLVVNNFENYNSNYVQTAEQKEPRNYAMEYFKELEKMIQPAGIIRTTQFCDTFEESFVPCMDQLALFGSTSKDAVGAALTLYKLEECRNNYFLYVYMTYLIDNIEITRPSRRPQAFCNSLDPNQSNLPRSKK